MKCFTFAGGKIAAGLEVRKDDRLGDVVFLGETGRGRRYEKIGFFRKDPAEIVNSFVTEAHPVKITVNRGADEKSFVVLAKPKDAKDQRVLVRINSYTGYVRCGSGGWKKLLGNSEALVHAYGAFGDAGRIGSWGDDLVLMAPGDAVEVHGSRSGRWVIDYSDAENAPLAMVHQDWEAKRAIDKGEDIKWA